MLSIVVIGVVFEVQVVLHAMLTARSTMDAHTACNQFRSFAEVFGLLELPTDLPAMGNGGGGANNTLTMNSAIASLNGLKVGQTISTCPLTMQQQHMCKGRAQPPLLLHSANPCYGSMKPMQQRLKLTEMRTNSSMKPR
jgi:hypothetical protein